MIHHPARDHVAPVWQETTRTLDEYVIDWSEEQEPDEPRPPRGNQQGPAGVHREEAEAKSRTPLPSPRQTSNSRPRPC